MSLRIGELFAGYVGLGMGVKAAIGGEIVWVPGVTRNEALKLCGNGVVPQQAAAAISYLWPVVHSLEVAA